MKQQTTSEKITLLRYHGECLHQAFCGMAPLRDDLLWHAQRAAELIKSIPRAEFGKD